MIIINIQKVEEKKREGTTILFNEVVWDGVYMFVCWRKE